MIRRNVFLGVYLCKLSLIPRLCPSCKILNLTVQRKEGRGPGKLATSDIACIVHN